MLSIANYNMHCGMDGWGRPYDYVAAIEALEADVIVLEESWTTASREVLIRGSSTRRLIVVSPVIPKHAASNS